MGLFTKRTKRAKRMSRRALRRAHTKTLKAQAQAEKRFRKKAARKAAKDRKKDRKKGRNKGRNKEQSARVAVVAPPVTADSTSEKKKAERKPLTPKRVKNVLGIVRVLSPVLAPLAYKAATAARSQLDAARARKIGVDVHQLGDFTGHGAALNARIAGLEPSLDELAGASTDGAQADVTAFRDSTRARLTELVTAVHAAERMPTARRKAAHRAIGTELDAIDAQVLSRLGVR